MRVGAERMAVAVAEASGCDVRLEVPEAVSIGECVELVLMPSDPRIAIRLPGVVHWSKRDARVSLVGVVLSQPVPREFLADHPACRRASIRFETELKTQLAWDHSRVTSRLRLLNYSRLGASLQSATMPVVGASLQLSWQGRTSARTMRGCVRWVTGQEGFFLVGCQLQGGLGYEFSDVDAVPSCDSEQR